jgi:hypothetical protein
MHAHKSRAGHFTARLGLESLEDRALLSATVPATGPAAAPVVSQSSGPSMQIQHQTTTTAPQAQAPYVHFSYHYGISPSAVILGTNSATLNGKSTGSVDFALVRGGGAAAHLGGAATALPIGFVMTISSADPNKPDIFHANFSVTLRLQDGGAKGELHFKGRIDGTLDAFASHLKVTFQSPLTQTITLGKHVYTVTMPSSMNPAGPNDVPSPLYALVKVTAKH